MDNRLGLDWSQIAIDMANLLLSNEPDKIPGGSRLRQQWLGLMLEFQMICLKHGVDEEFKRALIGEAIG